MNRSKPDWAISAGCVSAALALACTSNDPAGSEPPEAPLRVRERVAPGVEISAIRTGWMGIEQAYWRYRPPGSPSLADEPLGVFESSEILLGDEDLRLVPLPGHTPGHVGVVLRSSDRYGLMAGDATFDRAQTQARDAAGVSQDVDEARASQDRLLRQLEELDTVLLPSHDLTVFDRLGRREG